MTVPYDRRMHLPAPVLAVGWLTLGLLWSATAEAASATLAWDPNAEADLLGYKVYYDTDSGAPYVGTQANEGSSPIDVPLASLADPNAPTITLTGLPSCTLFYFAVTAYDSAAESDYSSEISAVIIASPNPVHANPSSSGALLVDWSGLPGDDDGSIDSYRIQYDTDSGEPYQGLGSPVDVTSFDPYTPSHELTGLVNGTTYYLVVESVCPDASSKMSDEVTGTPNEQGSGAGGSGASGASGGDGSGASGAWGGNGSGASGAWGGNGSGAGPTGASGPGATAGATAEDSGCGCRTVAPRSAWPAGARFGMLLATLGLLARRRRSAG
jgi:hypothetical protein